MVAERDRVDSHPEELIGEPRRDADAVRGVLAVHDAGVDLEVGAHGLQALVERPPPGGADDVGDEEDPQEGRGYGTPSVADGYTWSETLFPPSAA